MKNPCSRLFHRAFVVVTCSVLATLASSLALTAPACAAPLHDAAAAGDVTASRELVKNGADVNAVEKDGATPLLQAVLSGREDAVGVLVDAGAEVNKAMELDGDVLRRLGANIEPGQRPHATALMVAAFLGNRGVVDRLLRSKADVRSAGDDGMQPLHIAAFHPSADVAGLLIDAGADVNARNGNAATPLHLAAAQGNVPVSTALLSRGAQVNAIDDQGRTPLDNAQERPNTELIALLTKNGAVAMEEMLGAKVDVSGTNPRLTLLVDRVLLDEIAPMAPRPLGIAVDSAGRRLFWTEFANDEIHASDLDGAHAEKLAIADLSGPIGIAFEPSGRQLYWTTDATYPRKVQRARADGSGVAEIASGRAVNRPSAIAADAASGSIFWSESVAGRIRRASLDGADIRDIDSSGISSESDRADAREFKALGIAVDAEHRKIYWTEMLDAQILRADLDGSNVETVVGASAGLELPAGIGVAGDRIYWADAATATIRRAKLDGSGIEDVLTGADGLIEPYALALDLDAARLYWTDASSGAIASATFAGKDVRTIVAPRGVAPQAGASECARVTAAAGVKYVRKAVNAIGTCLRKMDALKAVWRRQSDAARAAGSCVRELDRLAGGLRAASTLEEELRAALTGACGTNVRKQLATGGGPVAALVEKRCAGGKSAGSDLDCVIASFTDAAYSDVARRFRRAAEWLEEARPVMAVASETAPNPANALVNLDRLHAALEAMAGGEPMTGAAASGDVPAGSGTAGTRTAEDILAAPVVVMSGQTTRYAALGVGGTERWTAVADDGATRAGAAPRYVDNLDGTISDLNTGLMWEKKCDGCGGLHDAEASYSIADTEGGVASWLTSLNEENGRGYAGHSDWRLPTIKELQTIVDYERFNPAVPRAFDGDACGVGCEEITKPECSCTGMMWHCSATRFASGDDRVFALGFNLGIVGDLRDSAGCAVRAVRGGAAPRS
jgi:ankyrin repeat protein/sugar lactone lactonase YvrE